VVISDAVFRPVAVRYGWANVPEGNLFNPRGPARLAVPDRRGLIEPPTSPRQVQETRPAAAAGFVWWMRFVVEVERDAD